MQDAWPTRTKYCLRCASTGVAKCTRPMPGNPSGGSSDSHRVSLSAGRRKCAPGPFIRHCTHGMCRVACGLKPLGKAQSAKGGRVGWGEGCCGTWHEGERRHRLSGATCHVASAPRHPARQAGRPAGRTTGTTMACMDGGHGSIGAPNAVGVLPSCTPVRALAVGYAVRQGGSAS